MRALLSVWDKTGLAELARELVALGWELYSTGRTEAALQEAGVPVRGVSELTAFPEILDWRVKTLHPGVHAGLLARRDDAGHRAQLAEHGFGPIDLVVSNLYPFVDTIAGRRRKSRARRRFQRPLPSPDPERDRLTSLDSCRRPPASRAGTPVADLTRDWVAGP